LKKENKVKDCVLYELDGEEKHSGEDKVAGTICPDLEKQLQVVSETSGKMNDSLNFIWEVTIVFKTELCRKDLYFKFCRIEEKLNIIHFVILGEKTLKPELAYCVPIESIAFYKKEYISSQIEKNNDKEEKVVCRGSELEGNRTSSDSISQVDKIESTEIRN